jgi:hypothetical protein
VCTFQSAAPHGKCNSVDGARAIPSLFTSHLPHPLAPSNCAEDSNAAFYITRRNNGAPRSRSKRLLYRRLSL